MSNLVFGNVNNNGIENKEEKTMVTLLEIFNRHLDKKQISSYEHPGCGMITNKIMQEIADDITACIKAGTLRSDDLHIKINYHKPNTKGGNEKLKGVIYIASHPLLDCYLDGLERKRPSCTGLCAWCYVFSDFFYKSFGKQLSMFANSILYMLEPERAEAEICDWLAAHKDKCIRDRYGYLPFRTDEAGDITYCLNVWLSVARKYPDVNFYAYTKQFDVINTIGYCINKAYKNFRILASDSTKDDPNPITKLREDYGSFAISFINPELNPGRVTEMLGLPPKILNKHRCPGVKIGCFDCGKCHRPETPETKDILANEH